MNDFEGLLATDYGFKPQGKSAPMAASKATPTLNPTSNLNFDLGSHGPSRPTWSSTPLNGSFVNDHDSVFGSTGNRKTRDFDDLFGGSARYTSRSESSRVDSMDFDSMFTGLNDSAAKGSNFPVTDKPIYDDDIFEGLPGLNSSSSGKYESAFSSFSSMPKGSGAFEDLLAGFGKSETESKNSKSANVEKSSVGFDDLLPGFGSSSPSSERSAPGASWHSEPTSSTAKTTSNVTEDPFVVLESSSFAAASSSGLFTDPLEEISQLSNSRNVKVDNSSVAEAEIYDDMDPFGGLGNSVPAFAPDRREREEDSIPLKTDLRTNEAQTYANKELFDQSSVRSPESLSQKNVSLDNDQETHQTLFDTPAVSIDSDKSMSPPLHVDASSNEADIQVDISPGSEEMSESSDDVWLTVSEIPLFTEPTTAPPPSRPPPPRPTGATKDRIRSFSSTDARKNANEFTYFSARSSGASPLDELEDFAKGRSQKDVDERTNGLSNEELEMSSAAAASAAAMKDAMDRAEAKFRHAKEVRERETTKSARNKEQFDKDEKAVQDAQERARRENQERLDRERLQKEIEEEDRLQKRLEKERERAKELEREREENEREQRRLERERERAREIEREREQARQAVQRATREARERAAVEARLKAERAVVGKINAEARERAERSAVQRVQAEARERAAAEAKERAERAAAEARARANGEAREKEAQERASVAKADAEARLKAERAAVQRAAAEARERAAAEARERAAAATRLNQQKNESDLESFFSMGRASSAPRPRATSDSMFDTQFQNRQGPGVPKSSSGTSSSMKKASSATNITDDLTSIFGGAAPSSGEFQEVEGETEDRRRARMERHQRTQERAAKALAEKNQRDLQVQREQAERHRIGETLDIEVKRWAAGKEGNLRALLSTLQYVLWPECGWQPVSLTDLITGAAVKKVYRKATLCIHPDKVQQKGANLQQKYIAEKVFDILKEAWNKFNSEELF